MDEVGEQGADELPLEGVGQMLCRIRGERGLAIGDIAEKTRIPIRHLESIESGDFSRLPGRTYAVGFSRTYARVLQLDENEIANRVRAECASHEEEITENQVIFEPGDPAKIPSRGLTWATAIAAVILMIGAGAFFAQRSGIGIGPDRITAQGEGVVAAPEEAAIASPISVEGRVAFTALEDGIWVRFYEAGGRRLMEKQMAIGEMFPIPNDAQDPQIWTGRPDAFAITIDGRQVAKLAEEETVIRDVPVSAEALLARNTSGE